ncbi:MAG: MarR family transcriptional regulator [Deltaproteobacteria bacterium]|nr:MarR family transcriptional regulator [Deltaproteobacteria bacterium]
MEAPKEPLDRRRVGARIALRILRASHIMERDANTIAQQSGLTLQQWFLLSLLEDEGGTASMTRMARFANVTRQNVAAMVSRMVQMQVVTTERDPKDRRSSLVTITESGKKRLNEAAPLRDEWTMEVFAALTDHDLNEIDRLLRLVYRSVAVRAAADPDDTAS